MHLVFFHLCSLTSRLPRQPTPCDPSTTIPRRSRHSFALTSGVSSRQPSCPGISLQSAQAKPSLDTPRRRRANPIADDTAIPRTADRALTKPLALLLVPHQRTAVGVLRSCYGSPRPSSHSSLVLSACGGSTHLRIDFIELSSLWSAS